MNLWIEKTGKWRIYIDGNLRMNLCIECKRRMNSQIDRDRKKNYVREEKEEDVFGMLASEE